MKFLCKDASLKVLFMNVFDTEMKDPGQNNFHSITLLIWNLTKHFISWLNVIIMSRTSFRMNLHSMVCLNVKELLTWSMPHIWSLSSSNDIRTHNHLVRKQTLNHLAKLAKWLSCVVSTYLYDAIDCMLLSCHVWVSEWIYTLWFAWMSRNALLKADTVSEV